VKLEGDERLLMNEELTEPGLQEAGHIQGGDAILVIDVEGLGGLYFSPKHLLAGCRSGLAKEALGVLVLLQVLDDRGQEVWDDHLVIVEEDGVGDQVP